MLYLRLTMIGHCLKHALRLAAFCVELLKVRVLMYFGLTMVSLGLKTCFGLGEDWVCIAVWCVFAALN